MGELIFAVGISIVYLSLQAYYLFYWLKIPKVNVPVDYPFTEGVTIIIVARNEEKAIGHCLEGILKQSYPLHLLEIIVVDDHSTDHMAENIMKMDSDRIRVIQLSDFPAYIHPPSYKKAGITLAVDQARFENIIITDADCVCGPEWLKSIIFHLSASGAVFQSAPVILHRQKSFLGKMQEMELLVLMLITGAGIRSGWHDMANGANMAFRKSAFRHVKGYEGNTQFASGDDMFLVEKMRQAFPERVAFVKSLQASVYTQGKKEWKSLIQQRLRWAGKNKGLKDKTIHEIWRFVGGYHALLAGMFVFALFQYILWWPFLIMLFVKWFADFIIVESAASFFKRTAIVKYFVPLQLLYTFYLFRLGWAMIMGKKGDWEIKRPVIE